MSARRTSSPSSSAISLGRTRGPPPPGRRSRRTPRATRRGATPTRAPGRAWTATEPGGPARRPRSFTEDHPGPAEPVGDPHAELRVVRGAPGERGVDVRPFGSSDRQAVGLPVTAHPRVAPRRGWWRTRRRGPPAPPRTGPPRGAGQRNTRGCCRAGGSAPPSVGDVDADHGPRDEPADRVEHRGGRHAERDQHVLGGVQRGAPGEAGERPQPALVVGEQQVVAPRDRAREGAAALGAGAGGIREQRTGRRAAGRCPAPRATARAQRPARWPGAVRRVTGTPPPPAPRCRRPGRTAGASRVPGSRTGPPSARRRAVRERTRARPRCPAAPGSGDEPQARHRVQQRPGKRTHALSTRCSQLSSSSTVSAPARRSSSASSPPVTCRVAAMTWDRSADGRPRPAGPATHRRERPVRVRPRPRDGSCRHRRDRQRSPAGAPGPATPGRRSRSRGRRTARRPWAGSPGPSSRRAGDGGSSAGLCRSTPARARAGRPGSTPSSSTRSVRTRVYAANASAWRPAR